MEFTKAIKLTPNTFLSKILGTDKNIIYEATKRRLSVTDSDGFVVLSDSELDKDLSFEEFESLAMETSKEYIQGNQIN